MTQQALKQMMMQGRKRNQRNGRKLTMRVFIVEEAI